MVGGCVAVVNTCEAVGAEYSRVRWGHGLPRFARNDEAGILWESRPRDDGC